MIAAFTSVNDTESGLQGYSYFKTILKVNSIISEAKVDQLTIIQELAHRIWPPTFGDILSEEQISYMLEMMYALPALRQQQAERSHIFLLAYENDSPVGFASYELNYKNAPDCKLHKIYILPEMQGSGIGRRLVDEIVRRATITNQHSILLNVNRYNKAEYFYKKYGFKIIAEEDIDIGSGYYMNDLVMRFSLNVSQ